MTLEELTEQVKAEAIDLAGTWERGSFETKLDLHRSLFGRYLYFEPEGVDPFLNQKNVLLFQRLWLYFADGGEDTDLPNDYESMRFEREVELGQVGVGDGI